MALDPARQAHTAAEAIRRLNHATIAPRHPVPAPVINNTVQGLLSTTERMIQALDQLRGLLRTELVNGTIRMDDGTDPATGVETARAAMADAVRTLERTAYRLREAAHPLNRMGTR